MKKELLADILKDDLVKLDKQAASIMPAFNGEDIHKLRTHTKKVRATLRLISAGKRQPPLKLSKVYKRLYHIAGNIRDAQLTIKRVEKWEAQLVTYIAALQQQIGIQKCIWENHYNKNITEKLEKNISGRHFHDLSVKAISKLFESHLVQVRDILHSTPDDDDIHTCRKMIKDILYNMRLIKNEWPEGYKVLEKYQEGELDELAEVIGNYNDDRMMLEHLAAFSSPDMSAGEAKAIKEILAEGMDFQQKKKVLVLEAIARFTAQNEQHKLVP